MGGFYMWMVLATLSFLASVSEAEEFCEEVKKIVLESEHLKKVVRESERSTANDPVKFLNGDFINYEHLAIRADGKRRYEEEKGKPICPYLQFTSAKGGDIKETLNIKHVDGNLVLAMENTLTKDKNNKPFLSLTGSVKQKERDVKKGGEKGEAKASSKHPFKGNFMIFHAEESVLGYIFCTERKGLKRVSFAISIKKDKRDDVEKTDKGAKNEIQKTLTDVKRKMLEIIKLYKDKSTTSNDGQTLTESIENKIRTFPKNCPK